MLWDLYQQYRIEQLDDRLARVQTAEAEDGPSRRAALELEGKVDRLAIICRAMFELMQVSSGVTEEQLKAKVVEIGQRDGHTDDKMTPQPKKCTQCGAVIPPQMDHCQFCGRQDQTASVFR